MAHLDKLFKKPGQPVESGEVVATVGLTPDSEEINLYFEIRHHRQPIDPSQWLNLKQ